MQALSERIEEWLRGATFEGYEPLGFTGLKTAVPHPTSSSGRTLVRRRPAREVRDSALRQRRPSCRIVFHLSQAGRVDFETAAEEDQAEGLRGAVAVLR